MALDSGESTGVGGWGAGGGMASRLLRLRLGALWSSSVVVAGVEVGRASGWASASNSDADSEVSGLSKPAGVATESTCGNVTSLEAVEGRQGASRGWSVSTFSKAYTLCGVVHDDGVTSVGDLSPSSALSRAARTGSCSCDGPRGTSSRESESGLPPIGGTWTEPSVVSSPGFSVWASSGASAKFGDAFSCRHLSATRSAGGTHLSVRLGPGSTSAGGGGILLLFRFLVSSSEPTWTPGLDTCTRALVLTSEPFEPFGTRGGDSVTSRGESVPQPSSRGVTLWPPCRVVVLRAKLSRRAPASREWARLSPRVATESDGWGL